MQLGPIDFKVSCTLLQLSNINRLLTTHTPIHVQQSSIKFHCKIFHNYLSLLPLLIQLKNIKCNLLIIVPYTKGWNIYLFFPLPHKLSLHVVHKFAYCKVASSRLSRLVAHFHIFRLFMKGNFDAYVLWPLNKMVQNWIVNCSQLYSTYLKVSVLRGV